MCNTVSLVRLGPSIDLHVGVHGSLVDNPPQGIEYKLVDAQHVFVFPASTTETSPYRAAHWGEFVEFESSTGVVHSARWPVLKCRAWVVDTDDLGVLLLGGRYASNVEFAQIFQGGWPEQFKDDIRRRSRNMIAGYAHPSCAGVLCRSVAVADSARRWIEGFGPTRETDALIAKLHVAYPAHPVSDAAAVRHKWRDGARPQVVFCGRDFQSKNGEMALTIFAALAREFPAASFVYIGVIPEEKQREHESILRGSVRYLQTPLHRCVIDELSRSHILFHPSQFESLGNIFLEAGAAGLAVVTATGGAMSHVQELFGVDGARLVDRTSLSASEEWFAFAEQLRRSLRETDTSRLMAFCNYERCDSGPLSLARRDSTISLVYSRAKAYAGDSLQLRALPRADRAQIVRWSSGQVEQLQYEARPVVGPVGRRVYLTSPTC